MMRRRSNAAAQFWEWGAGEGQRPFPRSSLEKPARLRETPSTVRDSGFGFVLSHPFAPSVRQRAQIRLAYQ